MICMISEGSLLRLIGNQTLLAICLIFLTASTGAAQSGSRPVQEWSEPYWTLNEKWAWGNISLGHPADFNHQEKIGLDPKNKNDWSGDKDNWSSDRVLSERFLKDILFNRKYRDVIPFDGVQISGARFKDKITLARFDLDFQLVLEKCRFENAVDFTNITVKKRLSFDGSYFENSLSENMPIDRKTLSLVSAKVDEHLSLENVTIIGLLDMGGSTQGV